LAIGEISAPEVPTSCLRLLLLVLLLLSLLLLYPEEELQARDNKRPSEAWSRCLSSEEYCRKTAKQEKSQW
jgi:hypothetical protein